MRQKFVCTILTGKYIKGAGGELERKTNRKQEKKNDNFLFDPTEV